MGSFDTHLVKVPKTGGSPVVLADVPQIPSSLAVDTNNVYWIEASATVNSVPKNGGAVVPLSPHAGVSVIAADDTGVYGLDLQCNVIKLAGSGGVTQVVAQASTSEAACGVQLALDDTHVYWSASNWTTPTTVTVYRVAKGGGTEEGLLTCALSPEAGAVGIAVDGTDIYWSADNPAVLLALPK
jgi:hypothetical protein